MQNERKLSAKCQGMSASTSCCRRDTMGKQIRTGGDPGSHFKWNSWASVVVAMPRWLQGLSDFLELVYSFEHEACLHQAREYARKMPELMEMVLEMENVHLELCDASFDHDEDRSLGLTLWSWAVWRSSLCWYLKFFELWGASTLFSKIFLKNSVPHSFVM